MHWCEVTKAAHVCSGVRNGGNEGASCTELSEVGNTRGKLGLEFSWVAEVGVVITCTIY